MVETTLTHPQKIELLEKELLSHPQVDCPVIHHFGPGIYIREVHLPADTLAIGHKQLKAHINIVLSGSVAMLDGDQIKVVKAPLIFTGSPGRKVGYILEDTVWQNIYATDETDVDRLEEMLLEKSITWQERNALENDLSYAFYEPDREDFLKVVEEAGFTPEQVTQISENEADQIPIPGGFAPKLTIRPSPIHGKGVFVSSPVKAGEIIAPARLNGMRTPAGRFTNHSMTPNAKFIDVSGDVYLVATKPINGCQGGSYGDEVLVDYRQSLKLSGINLESKI